MNATEIAPKTGNTRLNDIQKTRGRLKVCVLAYFVVPLFAVALNFKSVDLNTWRGFPT